MKAARPLERTERRIDRAIAGPNPEAEVIAALKSVPDLVARDLLAQYAEQQAKERGVELSAVAVLQEIEREMPHVSEDEALILPTAQDLALMQADEASDRGRRDLSNAPRWQWTRLHGLVGSMIPGDLIAVGALTGNGKTSFLLSQLDWHAKHGVPTLYLPLEVDPAEVRRRWAAWELGLDYSLIARNEWHLFPEGTIEKHERTMLEQAQNPLIQFPPDRRVTLQKLAQWIRWGIEQIKLQALFIDHFHRMDFGAKDGNYRVQVTETIRAVKDLAREHQIAVVAAAQLNTHQDPLDRYLPPTLNRLKESSGIGEEADVVLMLSRRLDRKLSREETMAVKLGHRPIRDFEDSQTMLVMCRKHRLDDTARDRAIRLYVHQGRVGEPIQQEAL